MVLKILAFISLLATATSNVAFYLKEKGIGEQANTDISYSWMIISTKHLQRAKCKHDEKFLSFTIDIIEMMRKFRCVPLNSPEFNRLAAGLSPAYLRVGGTPQDFLQFDFSQNSFEEPEDSTPYKNCTPHFQSWRDINDFALPILYFDRIAEFAGRNNLSLIFGLNGRRKNKQGKWDFENISKIVYHSEENNYKDVHWQIGNEPYRYRKYGPGDTVTPEDLSNHFKQLSSVIPKSRLSGPDITRVKRKSLTFFTSFLRSKPKVHAITYHHYFMHSTQSTPEKYLDVAYLDGLEKQMSIIKQLLVEMKSDSKLWLGEQGSSSGGGKKRLSDSYIAGFHYLGSIGLASMYCHKTFIRQSFYGGYYGMLDPITHSPLPDYWTTYIFKKLVGRVYLNEFFTTQKDVRVHAYCHKKNNDDVTLVYINYRPEKVLLLLDIFFQYPLEIYSLTPRQGDLLSKDILLNGEWLRLDEQGNFPEIKSRVTSDVVELESHSYGFIVVKNISVASCKT